MGQESNLCRECANWKNFKEKCWFFWDGKKECSQHKEDLMAEPRHKNTTFDPYQYLQDMK